MWLDVDSETKNLKIMSLKEIGPRAQNMLINVDSTVNTLGEIYATI